VPRISSPECGGVYTKYAPLVKHFAQICRCSMVLSPINRSEKMSPYEGDGNIEHEGSRSGCMVSNEVGVGRRTDTWQHSYCPFPTLHEEATFGVWKGGRCGIGTWGAVKKDWPYPGCEAKGRGLGNGSVTCVGCNSRALPTSLPLFFAVHHVS